MGAGSYVLAGCGSCGCWVGVGWQWVVDRWVATVMMDGAKPVTVTILRYDYCMWNSSVFTGCSNARRSAGARKAQRAPSTASRRVMRTAHVMLRGGAASLCCAVMLVSQCFVSYHTNVSLCCA